MTSSKLLPKLAFALVAGLVSTGAQAVQFNSLTSDEDADSTITSLIGMSDSASSPNGTITLDKEFGLFESIEWYGNISGNAGAAGPGIITVTETVTNATVSSPGARFDFPTSLDYPVEFLFTDSLKQTSDEALTSGNLSSSTFAYESGGDLSDGSVGFEHTFTVSFDIFINGTCEGRTFTVRQRPTEARRPQCPSPVHWRWSG